MLQSNYGLLTPRQPQNTGGGLITPQQKRGGILGTGEVTGILGRAAGEAYGPYAGIAAQGGLNAILDVLRSTKGANVGLLQSIFGQTQASPYQIGAGSIASSLGPLAGAAIGTALSDKPYAGVAGAVGGYGAGALGQAAYQTLAGVGPAVSLGTNLASGLVQGLPSLGVSLLTSLLSRNMDPTQQQAMNFVPGLISPLVSGLAQALGWIQPVTTGLSLTPFLPVIGQILNIGLSMYADERQQHAENKLRRRGRAQFGEYVSGLDPSMTELMGTLKTAGQDRLNSLRSIGITDPAIIQNAFGIDPTTGYSSGEEFVTTPVGGEWIYGDPEQQALTRLLTGKSEMREVAQAPKLNDALNLFASYADLTSKGLLEKTSEAMPADIQNALANYWGGGFTGEKDWLTYDLGQQRNQFANMTYNPDYGAPQYSYPDLEGVVYGAGDPRLKASILDLIAPYNTTELQQEAYNKAVADRESRLQAVIQPYEAKRQTLADIISTLNKRTLSPYGAQTTKIVEQMEALPGLGKELEALYPGVQAEVDRINAESYTPVAPTYSVETQAALDKLMSEWKKAPIPWTIYAPPAEPEPGTGYWEQGSW